MRTPNKSAASTDATMTLLQFVLSRHAGDNPRGDFIRDARAGQRLPRFGEGCARAVEEYENLKHEFAEYINAKAPPRRTAPLSRKTEATIKRLGGYTHGRTDT